MQWVSRSNPTYLRVYARQRPGGVAWDAVPLTVRGLNKAAGNPPFFFFGMHLLFDIVSNLNIEQSLQQNFPQHHTVFVCSIVHLYCSILFNFVWYC